MPTGRARTRLPRAERERAILAAAREVFSERGYGGGSVAEVAERAGVVEGTVFSYFDTKQALLLRVISDFYEALIEDVETGLRAVRGAQNRLRFLVARHMRVFVQDLGLCRVVLSELRPDPALYGESVLELNRRYTSIALDVIVEGIRAGELRDDVPPAVLRDLLFGGAEHALWRFANTGADVPVDELGEQLATLLLEGALPRRPPVDDAVDRLERAVAALERRAGAVG